MRNTGIDPATEESHQWTINNEIFVNTGRGLRGRMHNNRLTNDTLSTNQDTGKLIYDVHFITEITQLLINIK